MDPRIAAIARTLDTTEALVQSVLEAYATGVRSSETFDSDGDPQTASQTRPDLSTGFGTPLAADRYEDLGALGWGGMGEVRRVRDRNLGRTVAMKIVRRELLGVPRVLQRFVEEARTSANLQHPGVVPVYDVGQFPDGRLYFTMKEVRGRTLSDVIHEVHKASRDGTWRAGPSGATFRRLIEAFRSACEAVASAHAQSVVHRDLKPDNVMLGEWGEVLVVDWGVAKHVGGADADGPDVLLPDRMHTRVGSVTGTPAYMAPEQAMGANDRVGPRSDVYALGAVLFHVLTDEAPFTGLPDDVVAAVQKGAPSPRDAPTRWKRPPLPDPLVKLCERAMALDPAQRPSDAGTLAHEAAAWLDGVRERERAEVLVAEARGMAPRIAEIRARGARAANDARALLETLPSWASLDEKRPLWRLQDNAASYEREADRDELAMIHKLQAALSRCPELPSGHEALAAYWRDKQAAAEAIDDEPAARRAEQSLRAHDDGRHAGWLVGDGALSLAVDAPGAIAEVFRFVERDRRLVEEPFAVWTAPIRERTLPRGAYQVVLRADGRDAVRYPVRIDREQHWEAGAPVVLPPIGLLGPDDVYVPAGPFRCGGESSGPASFAPQRVDVPGFVIRRFPVTNREYIAFLDDLVARGRADEALAVAPRERGRSVGDVGAVLYGRDPDGRFHLVPDPDGDVWDLEFPVLMVDHVMARAYAAWLADNTGLAWRLPYEVEWEKAARGTDGRRYPWGDSFDATFANVRGSSPGRPFPVVVGSFPLDASPYGVRGLGGNVRDWMIDPWRGDRAPPVVPGEDPGNGGPRITRGGYWLIPGARMNARFYSDYGTRFYDTGFRVARSYP
jgi:formylglycine-generating enzyme required for sulfatase activity/tRNA A-37 threonylcarbamoyl transferase component Bud32